MAEEQDDGQRTEPPSQKRLDEARERGQVAISREVASFMMITVAAGLLWRGGRRRDAGVFVSILLVAGSLAVAARPASFFSKERLETVVVRFEIWKGGLRLGASRPLLGAGAGGCR